MTQRLSRREFLGSAGAAAVLPRIRASAVTRSPSAASDQPAQASSKTRIVDMHVHFRRQESDLHHRPAEAVGPFKFDGVLAHSLCQPRSCMFEACDIPERTCDMIMGGTLVKMLGLPD